MSRRFALLAVTAVLTSGLTAVATADPSPAGLQHRHVHVCGDNAPPAGEAECNAIRDDIVDGSGTVVGNGHGGSPDKGKPPKNPPPPTTTPRGYGPADLQAAYGLAGAPTSSPGPWVAIVDAYDDPTAQFDLNTYRAQFGLPACPATSCFRKVNQAGGTRYPTVNGGWAQEISLDLDMVSAACPNCRILLVEASSNSFSNLAAAVNYAATQGVAAISNSYGGSDFSQSQINGYDHAGIAITASTGDGGYGVEAPASFDSVIAVGGTSLTKTGSTFTETAWSGAGSGCSTQNPRPSWQQNAVTQCSGKALADVSAVADPATGVAVYDSTSYQGVSGWLVFGGTSASSPLVASVYALGGNLSGYPASYTWSRTGGLHDVTAGSNGSCSPALWCSGVAGWDGPTGLGTPNGASAF